MNWLVRLYPRPWRKRYGEEFAALLEQTNGGWRDALDIARGAMIMQLSKTTTLALGAVAGLTICLAVWAMHDTGYQASVTARSVEPDPLYRRAQLVLSRKSLTSIIERYNLFPVERKSRPLEDVIEEMRNRINISPVKPEGVSLIFHYDDELKAGQVAAELSSALGFSTTQPVVSKQPRFYFKAHLLLEYWRRSLSPTLPRISHRMNRSSAT